MSLFMLIVGYAVLIAVAIGILVALVVTEEGRATAGFVLFVFLMISACEALQHAAECGFAKPCEEKEARP